MYEELWQRGQKARLRTRAILAGAALVLGAVLVNGVFGVAAALVVAAADTALHWWVHHRSHVWRRGLRGDERMARLLRFTLELRGHRVLHTRTVPGHGTIDQLLVGPGGVWLIHNDAWHPDTEINRFGGRLFIDGRTRTAMTRGLKETAATAGRLISERAGMELKVVPLHAVHGGKVKKDPFTADGIVFARPLRLLLWIIRHPHAALSPEDVETVARAAVHALPIGGRTMTSEAA
ncbi:MAG: NERD domain-containing protein [Actinomadura rubrobrunea]|nr:NERD domain-containing protein [Actinomadura rubrobrunea]